MQTSVLDGSLHALAALLPGGIGQTDDDDGWQTVGIVHFDFDDDAFKPDDGTGKHSRKHGGSVDEEEGNVNWRTNLPAVYYGTLFKTRIHHFEMLIRLMITGKSENTTR